MLRTIRNHQLLPVALKLLVLALFLGNFDVSAFRSLGPVRRSSSRWMAPSSKKTDAVKIPDWRELNWPPDNFERRFGPNWTTNKDFEPVRAIGSAGALAWAISDSKYTLHPELREDLPVGQWLKNRRNIGVCMSGGGQRAAVCALGWFRALHHLGILQEARYIAANSGSTWTSLPLCAKQVLEKKEKEVNIDYGEYLGTYVEPEKITLNESELGLMGKVLREADVLSYQLPTKKAYEYNDWCDTIERNFVEPHLPWESDSWFDLSNAYLWNTIDVLDNQTMPFPIYVATAFETDIPDVLLPMEFTHIYSGFPVSPRTLGPSMLGGGFLQGDGLNTPGVYDPSPVPVDENAHYIKTVKLPMPPVKLCQLTGASSSFASALDASMKISLANSWFFKDVLEMYDLSEDTTIDGYLEPGTCKFWSPTSGGSPVDMKLVDGGLLDNLAVHPLIRRGCSTIVVCISNDASVTGDWETEFYDFASLFGRFRVEGMNQMWVQLFAKDSLIEDINRKSQIFSEREMDPIVREVQDLHMQGKPLVVRKKLRVRKNKEVGIFRERDVDFIFCFNESVSDWADRLPLFARKAVADLGSTFPRFGTTKSKYAQNEVNSLVHLCSFSLTEGLKNVGFDISQVEKG